MSDSFRGYSSFLGKSSAVFSFKNTKILEVIFFYLLIIKFKIKNKNKNAKITRIYFKKILPIFYYLS